MCKGENPSGVSVNMLGTKEVIHGNAKRHLLVGRTAMWVTSSLDDAGQRQRAYDRRRFF